MRSYTYCLMDLGTRKIFHSRHVHFDETATLKDAKSKDNFPDHAGGQWESLFTPTTRTAMSPIDDHNHNDVYGTESHQTREVS